MAASAASRIVVTGKGGVGKTTLSACLAALLARSDRRVLAVDADPQMNLPWALGVDAARARAIVPLSENADYVEEKTGIRPGPGSMGSFFKLNPDMADAVPRFATVVEENLAVLVMGTVRTAGAGCLCAENVLLDATLASLPLRAEDFVILDTQAGVEHFGRGIARDYGTALVVSDDTLNALAVAWQSADLAHQSGIADVVLVVNRARPDVEARLARAAANLDRTLDGTFARVVTLPPEPALADLEPAVTRILAAPAGEYADGVRWLAGWLTAQPIPTPA